ncbi:hypothetical protein GCM10027445_50490 [Amycolatopsis endophytica]
MRVLTDAEYAVTQWTSVVREGAEGRVGSMEAEAVITDEIYCQALELSDLVHRAAAAFRARAEQIERGGR